MIQLKLGTLLIAIILLCSCQANAQAAVTINGLHANTSAQEIVIASYFQGFNDIYQWSEFATDDFIKRVYQWCSGDLSENKSIATMKKIYSETHKNSLRLTACTIDQIDQISPTEIDIYVTREWEDGEKDQTAYSIIQVNQEWKFDQRF